MRFSHTLVILSPGFPCDENDTTCLPAQQLFVKALNRNFPSLKIFIVALQYPYHKNRYSWFGNLVIPMNGKGMHILFRPFLWLKVNDLLTRIEKQTQIAGVLSFWCQEAAFIASFFSRRKKIKHLIWIKGQDARKDNRFVRWINPKQDELVALSDFLAEEFEKNHGIRPMHVIPNGIDQNHYPDLKHSRQVDVLGVGSLIPLKQYSIFVDVVNELVKVNPLLKVVLAGAGPEENNIRHQITGNNISENIVMAGEVSHDKVLELMSRAKILLHPSIYEGYSTVCLEALYAGCHVVSFTSAEKKPVSQWHIVKNVEEMISRCNELLTETTIFSPVIVHTMDDSAKKMMRLFS